MHSAFLETATGWRLTHDPDAVLDHEGDLLLSEDEDDRDTNLAAIGARTGQFAAMSGSLVILTDAKLHWGDNDAKEELFATGSALVFHTSFVCGIMHKYSDEKSDPSWDGVVAEKEGDFFRLRIDQAKWEKLDAIRQKKWRKTHRTSLERQPCKDDFWDVASCVDKESGCDWKDMRLDQLCMWIFAHDVVIGKRAVNKHLRDLALRWCNDRTKSRNWLKRWVSETVTRVLDERLAAVCRLGDRNSRHQAA